MGADHDGNPAGWQGVQEDRPAASQDFEKNPRNALDIPTLIGKFEPSLRTMTRKPANPAGENPA
jgi:hypothetical protein